MHRRVAVTGMGMITPAGNNAEDTFNFILTGKTAIDKITKFSTEGFKAALAAEIKDFDPELYIADAREIRRMDLFTQYALTAVKEAVDSSGLDFSVEGKLDKTRCGVIFGSGIGGMNTSEAEITKYAEKGPARVSPLYVPMLIANIACGRISIMYGLEGHGFCPVTACSTGTHAIGEAARAIRHGYADVMITGGAEAAITPTAIAGFQNMTALSNSSDRETGLLPFDRRRSGFVMGEGAGALVLEDYEAAKKRGAVIYGEIKGYAATFDAHHITAPDPGGKGAVSAMTTALRDAALPLSELGYINAHGTGTPINDKFETLAIKKVFGGGNTPPVSSTKGAVGHMLGAAGAVEAVISALALKKGILPPTANLCEPDPECDLDYIPLVPRETRARHALSVSLGFGATNAAVVISKSE